MLNWFLKCADSDKIRIKENISRLEFLRKKVHDLAYFVVASQSGGHKSLEDLLQEPVVRGRPLVLEKLESALIGENNQKIALDAPTKFQGIMLEAENLIIREINKEAKDLAKLSQKNIPTRSP